MDLIHWGPLVAIVLWLFFLNYTFFCAMRFTVDDTHVRVLIYGWTARKVALADIAFADRAWTWWNEHYVSSLRPSRFVRLRRRTGLFKDFVITPENPPLFLEALSTRGVLVK